MRAQAAFALSLMLGLIGAVLVLGLPLLVGYGLCIGTSWVPLFGCNPQTYLTFAVVSIITFTLVVGIVGLIVFLLFSRIPSKTLKTLLALAIIAIGVILFQPEIDLVGLAALAFTFSSGRGKK